MNERTAPRRWLEDPRLSLDGISPGQRYTAAVALALAVAMLTIGVPRGGSGGTASADQFSVPAAVSAAGLVQAPSAPPPTAAYAPPAAFPSAPATTTTTMAPSPAYEPAPSSPPPSESPTTTTTAPPAPALPIPGVTIPS